MIRLIEALNYKSLKYIRQEMRDFEILVDPKKAMEAAMGEVRKPRSATIFEKLAKSVDFRRCEDRSFIKLTNTLRKRFARQDR